MEPSRNDQIVQRAQRDPDYRARLLADPAAAVAEAIGVPVPEGLTILVVEEQPGEAVLVLPPAADPTRIDEASLADVAGGTGGNMGTFGNRCSGNTQCALCP